MTINSNTKCLGPTPLAFPCAVGSAHATLHGLYTAPATVDTRMAIAYYGLSRTPPRLLAIVEWSLPTYCTVVAIYMTRQEINKELLHLPCPLDDSNLNSPCRDKRCSTSLSEPFTLTPYLPRKVAPERSSTSELWPQTKTKIKSDGYLKPI